MYSVAERLEHAKNTLGHNPFCVIEWVPTDGSWEWCADEETGEVCVSTHILGDPLACCRVLAAVHNYSILHEVMAAVEAAPTGKETAAQPLGRAS